MIENLPYFAWFYVGGLILMAIFIRLYLYKKRQGQQKK
jgi:Mg2+ and Co2+ transporter CorA|tara:strand:+ start:5990 stop:6103 length:114 start_codon:yes stop_codon:yes gene_type:complete